MFVFERLQTEEKDESASEEEEAKEMKKKNVVFVSPIGVVNGLIKMSCIRVKEFRMKKVSHKRDWKNEKKAVIDYQHVNYVTVLKSSV